MDLRIGLTLYGYCSGFFGRDSYTAKRVEAFGIDWVVVREIDSGEPKFADFETPEGMVALLNRWAKENQGD